ncbi:MAG TPA: efflux RND transporter permease subunit [Candidatus Sulfotelmatobacter sp.]|jgi:CzcA family heavy metal efflux pump|nr:efflux RND transporter permease subunit [Candidatus Sulfotelmatobacter sp.]
MLSAIVRFSIRFRGIAISLACALLGYGIFSLSHVPYDVFPEFAPPEVSIQTEAPGLSPEQVEVLVTQPIENAINGVAGIETLRSRSIQGLSVVTVVFRSGSDIYRDRQAVTERLSKVASELPTGVQPPLMTPLTSSTTWVMEVGLTSDKQSLMTLRTIADWTVKPRVLAVSGVAGVEVNGGEVRQLQFQFDSQRLVQYGVSVEEVIAAARRATGVRGAGFVDTPNQRIVLQTEGQSVTAAELARTVLVHHNGANVTLGDVARVVDAPAPAIGAASIRGKPGVILIVDDAYGSNTLEVTHGVDKALADLGPSLAAQGISIHPEVFRAADFIDVALHNVRDSLLIGAVLVVVVLFLFLFNFRTAAISCTAIPLSLLAAVIALDKMGLSLNTMTLGGLSIAIGEVVDDAVIDVENIYRRLRENRASPNPRSTFQVLLDASIEVRSAVVYATFAVILVFLPVLNMSGLAGRIFGPLGVAYIWAILASLVVALTVTPALCMLLLGERDLPPQEPPAVHWMKSGYHELLIRIERVPRLLMAAVALFVALGIATLFQLSESFLPELREGNVTVHMTAVPGTSLQESMRLGDRITEALLKIPSVQSVAQRAGRAELGTDTMGTHESEIDVNLKARNGQQVKVAQAGIQEVISQLPGPILASNSFLTERINETLSGYRTPVVVNVFGNDLDQLDQEAGEIVRVLNSVRGAVQIQVQSPPGMPQILVRLRKDDVARWGFDPLEVLDVIRTAYGSETVGQIYEGNRVYDVAVVLAPSSRPRVTEIGALPLRSPDGNYVALRQLADISESSGRYVILHQGARRVQTVTCNVQGRAVDSFVAEAQKRISQMSFPSDTYVEFSGTAAAQAQSRRDLLVNSLLAGLGIVLLLSVVMGNYRNLLLVLANLPFALVGGVLAALLTGGNLSLGSLVGFVTLFGITLRNSIMLISHYEHLVEMDGMNWGLDTALRGASERLAPILMTALVTGLGLLPLAIGSGDPGREIEGPMATVILGGLVTSTLLNLLILPTLALRYGRFEARQES